MHGAQEQVSVLGPVIDKINIVSDVDYPEFEVMCSTSRSEYQTGHDRISNLPANFQSARYYYNWHINMGARNHCLVQADPRRNRLRLSFNPSKAGANGIHALQESFEEIFALPIQEILPGSIVTRLDLAVDVSPVDIEMLQVFGKQLSLTQNHFGPKGAIRQVTLSSLDGRRRGYRRTMPPIETRYVGAGESNLQFCIYDKFKQSNQPAHEHTVRIEARLKNGFEFDEMQAIANPFERLDVFDYAAEGLRERPTHKFLHFLDSVRLRGFDQAIKMIADSRTRRTYRDQFRDIANCTWWNPDDLFEEALEQIQALQNSLLSH